MIDFALKIPGVDLSRIGLFGLAFGGFVAPRAAAFDKRIKVYVVDPGSLSFASAIIGHLQRISNIQSNELPPELGNLVKNYAWKHGVPESGSVKDVIQALQAYDNISIVDKVTCETLVMDGTAEMNTGEAKKLFDAFKCTKDYMLFDETTTAQLRTQMGAYATATEYLFDWLDSRL